MGRKQVWLRMAGKFMTTYFFADDFSNQLWLCMAGKFVTTYFFRVRFEQSTVATYCGISKLFIIHIRFLKSILSFHWRSTRDENWKLWCGYVWRENSCLHIFSHTVIWLMSHLLTADNRPGFLWNMDTYVFGYLLRSDQYVSNQYILDRNPRLSSYTIGVTYSDYI